MQKELLSPGTLTGYLKARRLELQNALELKLKSQKTSPQGHLRIVHPADGRPTQFYHLTDPKNFNGTYIPRAQNQFIKKLAQKDYDLKLIKLLQAQLRALDKLLDVTTTKTSTATTAVTSAGVTSAGGTPLTDSSIDLLYSKLNQTRQSLITPVTLTDAQYIEEWQNISWQGLPFSEDSSDYTTALGERVRSKSEVIIADTLNRFHVPYRYEYPLKLKGGQTFYPDFLCLNVRTRREYIWEHFGMMDDASYLEKALWKLQLYNDNDYFLGINLIITMEAWHIPIKTRQFEQIIKNYLLR